MEGFETPFGMELLATVHWLMTVEKVQKSEQVVQAFHDWAPRKRQFTAAQIELAAERLQQEGWV